MAVFSSSRERRLWLWTLAVVVAIYSTLGLARTLAGMLRDFGLLEASFVLGMLLLAAAIIAQGVRARPGWAEIAVALGVTATTLMVFARIGSPEERTHLIEYGVVGLLIHEALLERKSRGRRVPLPPLLAILATAALGLLDECIQAFLPSRVFDPRDILFNLLAGTMAVSASVALTWAWRRRNKAPSRAP